MIPPLANAAVAELVVAAAVRLIDRLVAASAASNIAVLNVTVAVAAVVSAVAFTVDAVVPVNSDTTHWPILVIAPMMPVLLMFCSLSVAVPAALASLVVAAAAGLFDAAPAPAPVVPVALLAAAPLPPPPNMLVTPPHIDDRPDIMPPPLPAVLALLNSVPLSMFCSPPNIPLTSPPRPSFSLMFIRSVNMPVRNDFQSARPPVSAVDRLSIMLLAHLAVAESSAP